MDARARHDVVVTGRRDGPVVMLSHGFGCDQILWRLGAVGHCPQLGAPEAITSFVAELGP